MTLPLRRTPFVVRLVTIASSITLGACATRAVPDPNDAVQRYVAAAKAGDTHALYGMLSDEARLERSEAELGVVIAGEKAELAEFASRFGAPTSNAGENEPKVKSEAKLRYADGETVTLTFERGAFRIASAGALPSGAKTPDLALDELRRVLARRSYAGILRVVTPATRLALENDLRSLVKGLERPETLPVRIEGDVADVVVPGGHHVRMKRQGGVWRVDDFD